MSSCRMPMPLSLDRQPEPAVVNRRCGDFHCAFVVCEFHRVVGQVIERLLEPPTIEYSVEASRTLVMKSSAPAASARIVESNGFALMSVPSRRKRGYDLPCRPRLGTARSRRKTRLKNRRQGATG